MIPITCKICGHDVRSIYDRQFRMNFFYCSHCRFLFRDDACLLPPEKEREKYLTHNNSGNISSYVDMFRRFIETAIAPYLPISDTGKIQALDFGSGPGDCVLAGLLAESGMEVDLYDLFFSPEKVFTHSTYHLITLTEVIEHVQYPMETLQLLKSHLKPGGILAMTTLFHPIIDGVLESEEIFQNWWYRRDMTHISFFQPHTFRLIAGLLNMSLVRMDERNTVVMRK